jgi:predicted lipoprotein with Yx(FWY)xxD motif
MKSRLMLYSTIIVMGTVLAACASATPTLAPVATQAPAPVATQAVAAPATQAAVAPATQPAAAAAGGIAVADSAKGKILVDGNGMTLYIYTKDSANTSTCSGGCAKNWPALAAVPAANVGAGVDASLLASITRADGTSQATYKGMPLYTFASDTKPGDLNGQGKGGVWYVISPAGAIINP